MSVAVDDEFGMLADNAAEVGLDFLGPPAVARRDLGRPRGRSVSAIEWFGPRSPVVFLHGGGQNAHTWDTVALALGRPALAIDLPGSGRSGPPSREQLTTGSPRAAAADVAAGLIYKGVHPALVVGMSFGGLVGIALAALAPELVPALVLVDIVPGAEGPRVQELSARAQHSATFDDFEAMLESLVRRHPNRLRSALRRGLVHNTVRLPDGRWQWRHRRFPSPGGGRAVTTGAELWPDLAQVNVPVTLARGMQPSSVLDDAAESRLLAHSPHADIRRFEGAGHGIQSDAPLDLARMVRECLDCGVRGADATDPSAPNH